MSIMKEFKAFALRGNVVDLAVGVIIGAAFGKIVSSFVNDIIMPPIGLLVGGLDFSQLTLVLKQGEDAASTVALRYGVFINVIIDFVIVAAAIFGVVKLINTLQKKEEEQPKPVVVPKEVELLTEIRDLLSKK